MPPLGHAVGFVDRQPRDLQLLESCHEPSVGKALRRHVQQADGAAGRLLEDLSLPFPRNGRVDRSGLHSGVLERVHLILHQGKER